MSDWARELIKEYLLDHEYIVYGSTENGWQWGRVPDNDVVEKSQVYPSQEQAYREAFNLAKQSAQLRLQTYAIDKDDAEKALGWKGVSLADSESVATGIEKLYAKLTEQYAHEGGIPQVMTKYILLTWLAALNIPRVVDTTVTNIPNVFYSTFANKLTGSEEQQISALGITLTHVDGTHVRGHYMLKWNPPRNDEP